MRYLFYTNYESGNSGLSNGIMSIEIGVVLAHLTNRFLVIDGNVSPPANVVAYDGRVSNDRPSRVTDLIDIPVPWGEPDTVDLDGLESRELTDRSLYEVTFVFPRTLDVSSDDARAFARGRSHWLTITDELDRVPVLRLSEDPLVPGTEYHRRNLCFYGYQFYLDQEMRCSVYGRLERMRAKAPFAALAKRVATELGSFNAVHMRRGDFKVTYGVTTLDRTPWEAIEAMDQVFDRGDPLVIVTDERADPFFDEIKRAYPHHYFIDWHVLDNYGAAFAELPQRDSLSLAYLSQLVAAESREFIGTMTSTFTSIIQRYRGNRGKHEPFRFLWNELPDPSRGLERGRHVVSDCIPLERGMMVEEFEGPYSWNRVNQRLNPAWMREWPESFLTREAMATGAVNQQRSGAPALVSLHAGRPARRALYVTFENLQVAVRSTSGELLRRIAPALGAGAGAAAGNVIDEFEVFSTGGRYQVARKGHPVGEASDEAALAELIKLQMVPVFARARRRHTWFRGAAFARAGRALVVAGSLGEGDGSLVDALQREGWDPLERGVAAIRVEDLLVLPFGVGARPEGAAAQVGRRPTPLASLVVATHRLQARDAIAPLAPSVAVAELIGASLDFPVDRDRAVERLCRLVEKQRVAQLSFSRPHAAARLLTRWAEAPASAVA